MTPEPSRRPEIRCLSDITGECTPEPEPELIDGVLGENSKLLISAPSKAGKTWLAIRMFYSLATGTPWLGMGCRRCTALYVNLEVSGAMFARRCEAVRAASGIECEECGGAFVMNARGCGLTASGLAQCVIEEFGDGLGAIFIDPLYMIEEGDENSVSDVKPMLSELDRLMTECGCSLVAVHHQPKGASGGKASIDRMAGSGAFARWPDALIDLSPLDAQGSEEEAAKPYRLTFDLRDFEYKAPVDVWFNGTTFVPDASGELGGYAIKGSAQANGAHAAEKNRERRAKERESKVELVGEALDECEKCGKEPTVEAVLCAYNLKARHLAGMREVSERTFRDWLRPSRGDFPFHADGGLVVPA